MKRRRDRLQCIALGAALGPLLFPSGCFQSASIDGTWSGIVTSTYYCESLTDGLQGSVTEDGPGRYSVVFENQGTMYGTLLVDDASEFATIVMDDEPIDAQQPTVRSGYVGILQKGDLQDVSYSENDLKGAWSGANVRLDSRYNVTDTAESTIALAGDAGNLAVNGTDGDGDFGPGAPGVVLGADFQTNDPYPGIFVSGTSGLDDANANSVA